MANGVRVGRCPRRCFCWRCRSVVCRSDSLARNRDGDACSGVHGLSVPKVEWPRVAPGTFSRDAGVLGHCRTRARHRARFGQGVRFRQRVCAAWTAVVRRGQEECRRRDADGSHARAGLVPRWFGRAARGGGAARSSIRVSARRDCTTSNRSIRATTCDRLRDREYTRQG